MKQFHLIVDGKEIERIELDLPFCPRVGEFLAIPFEKPGVGCDIEDKTYVVDSIEHVITYGDERCLDRIYHFTKVYLS